MKTILKLGFASGLIYWLYSSGKLQFTELEQAFQNPFTIISSVLLFIFVIFGSAFRIKFILDHENKMSLSNIKLFLCNWIGAFFNTVIPGSVSGDLIKIFYIKDIYQQFTKKYLLFSIFADRLMGLFALVSMGALIGVLNLEGSEQALRNLIYFNILVFAGIICFFTLLFFPPAFIHNLLAKISNKLSDFWSQALHRKFALAKMYLISFALQGIIIFIFWFVTNDLTSGKFTLVDAYTIVPFGFIITALPIAPAGLGVGHFAFQNLFQMIEIENGASLFNVYFCVYILTNITGTIPYALFKKDTKNQMKKSGFLEDGHN